jgi:acyl carrier protein
MEEFLEKMAELLEVDTVQLTDIIVDFDAWDSLTTLSIIALADEEYEVSLTNKEIVEAQTIEGLYNFIIAKRDA